MTGWAELLQDSSVAGSERSADRLARAVVLGRDVAPAVVACSITEIVEDGFRTPVFSDELAMTLDQVQYRAADGPCVAAARDQHAHRLDDIVHSPEFPQFCAAAVQHGVRSSLSLPIYGGATPAALNLYADAPLAFESARSRQVSELLARCLAGLLGHRPPVGSEPDEAAARAVADGELVQSAQRLVMSDYRLDAPAAFARLIDLSRLEQRSIVDIAADLVSRRGRSS